MLGVITALTLLVTPQDNFPEIEPIQLVVLRSGPQKPEPEELGALQSGHLKFLESLWDKRQALAVGPLENGGEMRGLVFLDCRTPEEAQDLMAADPYVKRQILVADVHALWCMKSTIKKAPKFMDLQKFWFGLLVRPDGAPSLSPEESKRIQEGHLGNIRSMAESGDLALAGPFEGDSSWRGILVFLTTDRDRVESLVAEDPAVKAGRLKLELYGWWASKGTFEAFKK